MMISTRPRDEERMHERSCRFIRHTKSGLFSSPRGRVEANDNPGEKVVGLISKLVPGPGLFHCRG